MLCQVFVVDKITRGYFYFDFTFVQHCIATYYLTWDFNLFVQMLFEELSSFSVESIRLTQDHKQEFVRSCKSRMNVLKFSIGLSAWK